MCKHVSFSQPHSSLRQMRLRAPQKRQGAVSQVLCMPNSLIIIPTDASTLSHKPLTNTLEHPPIHYPLTTPGRQQWNLPSPTDTHHFSQPDTSPTSHRCHICHCLPAEQSIPQWYPQSAIIANPMAFKEEQPDFCLCPAYIFPKHLIYDRPR